MKRFAPQHLPARSPWNRLVYQTAPVLAIAAVWLLSGCSGFQREWKSATTQAPPASGIVGPWKGRWKSDVNGHEGRLRCLVSRNEEGGYEAWFHAKYRRILGFQYAVDLNAVAVAGDRVDLEGRADLGWYAGGVYHYRGHADPREFFSTYKSKSDAGVFEMQRP